jgi:hypothetical protein
MKRWIANLSFVIIELVLIFFSLVFARDAMESLLKGDYAGYINELVNMIQYIRVVNIAFLVISILYLVIKPLRTKMTCFLSICNIIGFIINMYLIYFRS